MFIYSICRVPKVNILQKKRKIITESENVRNQFTAKICQFVDTFVSFTVIKFFIFAFTKKKNNSNTFPVQKMAKQNPYMRAAV